MSQSPLFGERFRLAPGKPITVLGIDLGNHTGYAIVHATKEGLVKSPYSGTLELIGSRGAKYARFARFLKKTALEHEIVGIGYEQVNFQQGDDWRAIYYGQLGMIQLIGHEIGFAEKRDILPVPTNRVKSTLTGSASAKKPTMVAHAEAILGRAMTSDHEADALGVGIATADWFRRRP